jgi:hypothetical protein
MTELLSAAVAAVPLTVICWFLAGVWRHLRTHRAQR